MKILVIVNESPWSGSLAVTALRLVRSMLGAGFQIAAVYFREDGIYQALPARAVDSGTPSLAESWIELGDREELPLLLCRSATQRRLKSAPDGAFQEVGLAEVLERMAGCDRIVTL